MPELPEVQTTVNGMNKELKNLLIKDVWTNYNSTFHKGKENIKNKKYFQYFKKEILGKKIVGAKRRAKNILINLSDGSSILVHLKMTGHLLYGKYIFDKKDKKDPWKGITPETLKDPFNRFVRFIIKFSNNKYLALSDMRRFAKVTHIHKDNYENNSHLKNIGPEPLENNFKLENLIKRLNKKPNGKVKTVLMDQSIIAGIGNIYSDEILWRSGILPDRLIKNINRKEIGLIFSALKKILKEGIDFGGDSMSDYRNIYGEKGKFQEKHMAYKMKGKKCKKTECRGIIERKVIGGRSAHYCPIHQK